MRAARALLLVVLPCACGVFLPGEPETFDNSGGPPPDGEPIEHVLVEQGTRGCCCDFEAFLARDEEPFRTLDARCFSYEPETLELAPGWLAHLEQPDDVLAVMSVELGGCRREFQLEAVHLEGDVVRPWLIALDTRLGVTGVDRRPCDADLFYGHAIVLLPGLASARAVEPFVGVMNPELPREDDVPVVGRSATVPYPGP